MAAIFLKSDHVTPRIVSGNVISGRYQCGGMINSPKKFCERRTDRLIDRQMDRLTKPILYPSAFGWVQIRRMNILTDGRTEDGVHHPLIHIYTYTKFQLNPPKHFQDMAPDTKVTDGRTAGQRQNNIPPPLAGDIHSYQCRTDSRTTPKQYPYASGNAKTISLRLWRGIYTHTKFR
ncbi:hypothetical protein DPMN_061853 [Dreissena polymorpha]|uniref:Uncharacterized protein n=1 Tax=Dreissena polymorpha TaxID=45954 RepID=A0A9D4C8K3_DREPO|nr:hypothetical protein DPMN_061853 [Dreissena polymorpha]